MSDDTTDTHVDNAEPSMEDILASIRRIIADEDVNAASNEGAAVEEPSATAETFLIIEANDQDSSIKELEIVDLQENEDISSLVEEIGPSVEEQTTSEIDMLLSELDDSEAVEALDMSDTGLLEPVDDQTTSKASKLTGLSAIAAAGLGAVASAGAATAKNVSELRKNPSPQSNLEALGDDAGSESLDLLIEDVENHYDAETVDVGSVELNDFLQIPDSDAPESRGDAPKDDIEEFLGNLFDDEGTDSEPDLSVDELVTSPAADVFDAEGDDISDELLAGLLGEEEQVGAEMAVPEQSVDDLDLVKSLMADLTADPFDAAENSPTESELVDDILTLSMDDEIALQPEVDAAIESADTQTSDAFVIDINDDLSDGSDAVENAAPLATQPQHSSLAEIAQEAKADAKRIERAQGFAAAGFAASAGMVVATTGSARDIVGEDELDAENLAPEDNLSDTQEVDEIMSAIEAFEDDGPIATDDTSQTEPETTATPQDNLSQQETADMPKAAAKKDAIINEVTEEATAGAFASLNQVVETKAVVEERGDRIGDLVQEALRPMLKEWLDKNLKGIVERAVTKEVKRISSGK